MLSPSSPTLQAVLFPGSPTTGMSSLRICLSESHEPSLPKLFSFLPCTYNSLILLPTNYITNVPTKKRRSVFQYGTLNLLIVSSKGISYDSIKPPSEGGVIAQSIICALVAPREMLHAQESVGFDHSLWPKNTVLFISSLSSQTLWYWSEA